MADPRFFEALGPVAIEAVAAGVGGTTSASGVLIESVASLEEGDAVGALVFAADRKALKRLEGRDPAAALVTEGLADDAPWPTIIVDDPKEAFARAIPLVYRERVSEFGDGVHPSAKIDPTARIAPGVSIAGDAEIGAEAVIEPGVVIGRGVVIGARTRIGAGASIYCAVIGADCNLLSGARIGEAGFGFVPTASGLLRVPQIGRVIMDDHVEIGANACVDRGAIDDTRIGYGTKIDNLVQVGHNTVLGRFCVLAGQAGVAGSVVIGDGVMIGGQAGLSDHLTIGDGAKVAAGAGLMHNVSAGEAWGGLPARPAKSWLRETATLAKLAKTKRG